MPYSSLQTLPQVSSVGRELASYPTLQADQTQYTYKETTLSMYDEDPYNDQIKSKDILEKMQELEGNNYK